MSNILNQPLISNFVGQKTSIHNSPVLTNKENTQQKNTYTCSAVKRSNEEHSLVEGEAKNKQILKQPHWKHHNWS